MNTYLITATIKRSNGRSEIKGEEKTISPVLALKKFLNRPDQDIHNSDYKEITFTIKKV